MTPATKSRLLVLSAASVLLAGACSTTKTFTTPTTTPAVTDVSTPDTAMSDTTNPDTTTGRITDPTTGSTTGSTTPDTTPIPSERPSDRYKVSGWSAADREAIDLAAPAVAWYLDALWKTPAADPYSYDWKEAWKIAAVPGAAAALTAGPANLPIDTPDDKVAPGQGTDLRGVLWMLVAAFGFTSDDPGMEYSWTNIAAEGLLDVRVETVQYLDNEYLDDPPMLNRAGTSVSSVLWPVYVEMHASDGTRSFTIRRHFVVEVGVGSDGRWALLGEWEYPKNANLGFDEDNTKPERRGWDVVDGRLVRTPFFLRDK